MAEGKVSYNVPKIGQDNAKICWLACYQMLYAWRGRSRLEPYERARRAGLSTTSALTEDKFGTARNAMWLTSHRVGYLKESAENLLDILRTHGPMWCAGNFLQGSGHAVVICGFDAGADRLRINDPYEIYSFPDTTRWLTYGKWCKLVRETSFACQVWT